jgi:hypothetical protein
LFLFAVAVVVVVGVLVVFPVAVVVLIIVVVAIDDGGVGVVSCFTSLSCSDDEVPKQSGNRSFIYTTHSWLIAIYLNCSLFQDAFARIEAAIYSPPHLNSKPKQFTSEEKNPHGTNGRHFISPRNSKPVDNKDSHSNSNPHSGGALFPHGPLHCPSPKQVSLFARAIKSGHITWHAFPFNAQLDLMDAEAIVAAVALTHALDRTLGVV